MDAAAGGIACDAGFFHDQSTKTCTVCPAGASTFHYSNASSVLDCLCEPGFENVTHVCEMCAHAFFKWSLTNRLCTTCHPDSQLTATGVPLCAWCLCRAGFFFELDWDGEKSCRACLGGTYKGELADSACTQCPLNHFICPANANTPEQCPSHSLSASGNARMEDCLCVEGFFFAYAADAPADSEAAASFATADALGPGIAM